MIIILKHVKIQKVDISRTIIKPKLKRASRRVFGRVTAGDDRNGYTESTNTMNMERSISIDKDNNAFGILNTLCQAVNPRILHRDSIRPRLNQVKCLSAQRTFFSRTRKEQLSNTLLFFTNSKGLPLNSFHAVSSRTSLLKIPG